MSSESYVGGSGGVASASSAMLSILSSCANCEGLCVGFLAGFNIEIGGDYVVPLGGGMGHGGCMANGRCLACRSGQKSA